MAQNATYALELRDLRKSFGKTEIIRGANLSVAAGERVAIMCFALSKTPVQAKRLLVDEQNRIIRTSR